MVCLWKDVPVYNVLVSVDAMTVQVKEKLIDSGHPLLGPNTEPGWEFSNLGGLKLIECKTLMELAGELNRVAVSSMLEHKMYFWLYLEQVARSSYIIASTQ